MTDHDHRVSEATFEEVREGAWALDTSWAVWAQDSTGAFTETSTHDMSVLRPTENPSLIPSLTTEFVFLGINRGLPDKQKYRDCEGYNAPLGVFHCGRSDHWLAHALYGTPGWGAPMTDLFKGDEFATKQAGPEFFANLSQEDWDKALEHLEQQLHQLGAEDATLVAFSDKVVEGIRQKWTVCQLVHYSRWPQWAAKSAEHGKSEPGEDGTKNGYRKYVGRILGWA